MKKGGVKGHNKIHGNWKALEYGTYGYKGIYYRTVPHKRGTESKSYICFTIITSFSHFEKGIVS